MMRSVSLLLCATALTAAAGNPVKYHPGHYAALEAGANLEAFPYLDEPGIRGFNIRYTWAALEPEENRYDFAAIRRDLAVAAHRPYCPTASCWAAPAFSPTAPV